MQISSRACLFGASPNTGNQGVNALCWSLLRGLAERGYDDIHVFDYRRQQKQAQFGDVKFMLQPMTIGKRFWQADHLERNRIASALGKKSGGVLGAINQADLVLDVSGGDSFTDLYGRARFRQIVAPKEIALNLGRPLVLAPQTYGPFKSSTCRDTARRLVSQSTLAFARDPASFDRMREFLGEHFDPARHRQGVDLAFGLPVVEPSNLDANTSAFLVEQRERPLIGLNISGLLGNNRSEARKRFGLQDDYPELMRTLVQRLLQETNARLIFIPHVHAPTGHYESDLDAAKSLLESLPSALAREIQERCLLVSKSYNACELKWFIAQCDWFSGARMHATIAAISSGVPTAALAYSPKVKGVFETCNQATSVIDLRKLAKTDVVDSMMTLWEQREHCAATLQQQLPEVKRIAQRQLDAIAFASSSAWCGGRMVQC